MQKNKPCFADAYNIFASATANLMVHTGTDRGIPIPIESRGFYNIAVERLQNLPNKLEAPNFTIANGIEEKNMDLGIFFLCVWRDEKIS